MMMKYTLAKRILAYTLFVLALLTVTFLRTYSWQIAPAPFLFWSAGIFMAWGGWTLLRRTPHMHGNQPAETLKKSVDYLKSNGVRVSLDLSRCEISPNSYCQIKSNDYTEPEEEFIDHASPPEAEMEIEVWEDLGAKPKTVDVHQSAPVFRYPWKGKMKTFRSPVLPYDRETLLFKLNEKKETTLYINPRKPDHYYFDLDFLQPHSQAPTD